MVSDTLTKALSTTSTDIANNRSSSSERKQPNWASRSHWHKREEVSGKGMSRDILPLRLGADTLWSRHSAQPFELALSIREWSSSGRVAYFVPACDALERFLFPVVPYPCRDGAIVSETASLTVIHFMSGNAWSYLRLVAYGFLGLSERA